MSINVREALEEAIYLFNHGKNFESYHVFGSKRSTEEDKEGYRFTVWAPRAKDVALVGDFSNWLPIQMDQQGTTGVWSVFVEEAQEGQCYKYRIENHQGGFSYKIDPFALAFEVPPKDASIIQTLPSSKWKDGLWNVNKRRKSTYEKPLNIYEVHFPSWMKNEDGTTKTFQQLAEELLPYVKEMGYTHIELMPIMEHPLEASWGYQITGYYAVAARYGTVVEFQEFVQQAHLLGLGVILDWVPGHFCKNDYALPYYDGTPTFEPEDYHKANNVRWGTLNFDLEKNQVQSFLISNAMYWMKEFHVDGIRVDAVSNMLYLDYDEGPWTPNEDGSNHYRAGVSFLQKLNQVIQEANPSMLMIAEESTAWGGVTKPVQEGGLGFTYKWNMGWMNDQLSFFSLPPEQRSERFHQWVTFSYMYAFNEQFILPISHDEVVHGKHSLLGRMPGDRYNQFANLRNFQAYMMAHPGKKLQFMGNETGQFLEWRFDEQIEWDVLSNEFNTEYQRFVAQLNQLYKNQRSLHEEDGSYDGITFLDADNQEEAVLSFIRKSKNERDFLVVVTNFKTKEHPVFQIGVPYQGTYEVLLNTESIDFGGTWTDNLPPMKSEPTPLNGQSHSITVTVPAQGTLYIRPKRIYGLKK